QPAAGVPDCRHVRRQHRNDLFPGGGRMTRRLKLAPVLALATALAACSGGSGQPAGPSANAEGLLRYGEITFEPCSLNAAGDLAVEAQCATLAVPENHDAPDGRSIELAIALVPASGMGEADPVFMIAGGPGQSALESYPMVHSAFRDARRNRHVVLVDARGTGKSHPLHCKVDEDDPAFSDPDAETPEAMRAFTERCRDELQKTSDLRYYTTGDHIRDLDL